MPEVNRLAAAVVLSVVGASRPVAADVPADDAAKAQVMFDQGRALIAANKIDEACETFEASLHLDPEIGTKLNLADCRERQGRLAIAYTLFQEAVDEAGKAGKTGREAFARQHRDALGAKLVRITLRIAEPELAGATVKLETSAGPRALAPEEWTRAIVVDPGRLTIDVAAPGRQPFHREQEGIAGAELVVDVPVLTPIALPIRVAEPPADHRAWTPIIVGGAGAALLVGSLGLVLHAKSNYNDAVAQMMPDELGRVHRAQHEADLATGIAVAGTVALALGAVLHFRGHRDVVVSPTAMRNTPGLAIAGRF